MSSGFGFTEETRVISGVAGRDEVQNGLCTSKRNQPTSWIIGGLDVQCLCNDLVQK